MRFDAATVFSTQIILNCALMLVMMVAFVWMCWLNLEGRVRPSIKAGSTRIVLLAGRWAIKIPRPTEWRLFLHGLLANMQEAQFSKAGWPELCPVLWSIPGGFLVVMCRARPIGEETWEFAVEPHLVDRLLNQDDYTVPAERKRDSFGWLDGRLVAVDYGS